jgi:hypothetical protein
MVAYPSADGREGILSLDGVIGSPIIARANEGDVPLGALMDGAAIATRRCAGFVDDVSSRHATTIDRSLRGLSDS